MMRALACLLLLAGLFLPRAAQARKIDGADDIP